MQDIFNRKRIPFIEEKEVVSLVRSSWSRMRDFFQEGKKEQVKELRLDWLQPNPYQPRKYFDSFQLEELAKSIKEFGVIQPIIVRRKEHCYELIAGERRVRASQSLGLKTIPAIVKTLSDQEVAEIALIENLQRQELNYFEEAEGYQRLIQEFKLTQEEVARKVGKSQSTIANKLRLLKLPSAVRAGINHDLISERHARALLKLPSMELQQVVLREIYAQELNVRETEQCIETQLLLHGETLPKSKEKKRIVRIFTDMRLYLNTLRSAVATIKEAGLEVKMKEKEDDNCIEVLIQINKPRQEQQSMGTR